MRKVLCLLFVLLSTISFGQTGLVSMPPVKFEPENPKGSVSGQVTTQDNKPVAYVTVTLKGVNKFTTTDEYGNFIISNIKEGIYTIEVTMIGLKPAEKLVEIKKDQQASINFILEIDAKELIEVTISASRGLNSRPVSVGRSLINPMDLPQSISVIGQSIIKNQQALRLSDVIKSVNGVYLASTRGSTQENFSARGYSFSSTNMFKDGVRINTGTMPEVTSLEKVEVLKGSAAILYGAVAPGGILNLVTRQPKFEKGGEIAFRTGSYDLYKPSVDFYGPISKKLAYRVNGTFESMGSFRDVVKTSKRYYVNPSMLFKAGEKTELLMQADFLKHNYTPDFGIGTYGNTKIPNVSISSFFGTPWQYANVRQTSAQISSKTKITEKWTFNTSVSHQNFFRDYFSTERIQAAANGDYARALNKIKTNEKYYVAQAFLNGKFSTGSLSHIFLAGADADRYFTRATAFNQPSIYDTINIFDATKYNPRTDIPVTKEVRLITTRVNRIGAYVQDLISISEKLKLLAGIRWSYQDAQPVDTLMYATSEHKKGASHKIDKAFSPRAGIVYKPFKTTSLFVSYANSFNVNSGTDVFGNALAPSIIDQYEAGIKNEFPDGRLSANLTFYRIVNNNLAQTAMFLADGVTPNSNTSLKALTGQTTSDGFELDIAAHPVSDLDINAGYSYNFIRYTKTPDAKGNFVEGERLINNPAHTGNASAFYIVRNGMLKGLRFGGQFFVVGTRYAGFNNTKGQTQTYKRNFEVKGYSTLDLTAGYSWKKVSVLAKISNVTNTRNFYVHENYSINPIAPRQFATTVTWKL